MAWFSEKGLRRRNSCEKKDAIPDKPEMSRPSATTHTAEHGCYLFVSATSQVGFSLLLEVRRVRQEAARHNIHGCSVISKVSARQAVVEDSVASMLPLAATVAANGPVSSCNKKLGFEGRGLILGSKCSLRHACRPQRGW